MYWRRSLEYVVLKASKQFPVLLLTGARQVGKTTLLNHLADASRARVTLDDPLILSLARKDPALFLQRFPPPVLIDEIQYAPELLPHIKMRVDQDRERGLFWLTGSQQFHMMHQVSESLAGRIAIIRLSGLSRWELLDRAFFSEPFLPLPDVIQHRSNEVEPLTLRDVYQLIWRGSFPVMALHPDVDWEMFYGSYVQTYLQRDVRSLARVGDEHAFLAFLRACAARTAQLLNLSDLARDAGISVPTAKAWLSILEASGIVFLLEPYHSNLTKRLVKTPKLYLLDTGLCCYLTQWTSAKALEAGAMSGAILETWVLIELLKGFWHAGRLAPFFFFRNKDRKEVDLLIVLDGTLYPLEIKKTASPSPEHARKFRALEKLGMPLGHGGVICLTQQTLPLGAQVSSIPVALI